MIRVHGVGAGRVYDVTIAALRTNRACGRFTWAGPSLPSPPPVALDLLRVGRAVHLADRLVRRGASIGRNLRRIRLEVAVAEPAKWRKLSRLVEELAEFATGGDSWTLSFVRGARDDVLAQPSGAWTRVEPTVVALFSGGLDSLCGAAHLATQPNSQPLFVSHSPPGRDTVYELARDTFRAFGRDLPRSACVTYRLEVREADKSGVRSMFQESSRRTRPLFYLSLVGATAIAHGASTIQMSENGALALSLPYRADVHGPSMARQAHTFLLGGFEALLRELVPGVKWWLTNPFVGETKGEACNHLGPAAALAERSTSCEYLGRQRAVVLSWRRRHRRSAASLGDGPQCGLCVPCIVRRAALRRAAIPDSDSAYFASAPRVLEQLRSQPFALDEIRRNCPSLLAMLAPNVLYMDRYCERLASMRPGDFAMAFLPELRANRQLKAAPAITLTSCHALAQRYAREVSAFLNG